MRTRSALALARTAIACAITLVTSCTFPQPADVKETDAAATDAGPDAGPDFAIGGTLTGLWTGAAVGLELLGQPDEPALLTVVADGTFTFDKRLPSGRSFTVAVSATGQPHMHTCTVLNAAGSIAAADVTDIRVECVMQASIAIEWSAPIHGAFDPTELVRNFEAAAGVQQVRLIVTAPAATRMSVDRRSLGSGAPSQPISLDFVPRNVELTIVIGPISRTFTLQIERVGVMVALNSPLYVKASNTGSDDQFGAAIAADGRYLAIGAPNEDSNSTGVDQAQNNDASPNSGAVYVFRRTGLIWTFDAYLKGSLNASGDHFGASVAILDEGNAAVLAVGAPGDDVGVPDTGAVYVFRRAGSGWVQEQRIRPPAPSGGEELGASVALSRGGLLVVGAPSNDVTAARSGAVYVFRIIGASWIFERQIKATNVGAQDRFGTRVAVSGNAPPGSLIAVSAPFEDSAGTGVSSGLEGNDGAPDSGAVYLFRRDATDWTSEAYIKASNTDAGDHFGSGLGLDDTLLAVGAEAERSSSTDQTDNGQMGAGAVYAFRRVDATWAQEAYLKAVPVEQLGRFGHSVAVRRDLILIGSEGALDGGAVHLFAMFEGAWTLFPPTNSASLDSMDKFGMCVALSGAGAFASASLEDGGSTGIATNPADNSITDSGAVYGYY